MNRYFAGIDPGLEGAIATLDTVAEWMAMKVIDTPLVTGVKSKKKYYNLIAMANIVAELKEKDAIVCVEVQQSMPKQGVVSQFQTGYGYGLWIGMLTAFQIRYFPVKPRTWQAAALSGQPGEGKARAILRCEQLFPEVELFRPGKKKALTGRADAAMMAYHSFLNFSGEKSGEK